MQAAHNQIINEREHGTSGQSSAGYGGYGYGNSAGGQDFRAVSVDLAAMAVVMAVKRGCKENQQNQYQDEDSLKFRAAANYINAGSYTEALHVLDSISNRNAQWYYLSALANARMGSNINAKEHARKAVELDPNNMQYRQLLSQLESGGQWYQDMGQSYGMPTINVSDWCCKILCLNAACGCLCPGAGCCGPGVFYYH